MAGTLALGSLFLGPAPSLSLGFFILGLGALLLEGKAISPGSYGYLSCAEACFLGLLFTPEAGPRATLLVVVAALGVGQIFRNQGVSERLRDLALGLFPISAAAAVSLIPMGSDLKGPFACLVTFFIASELIYGSFFRLHVEARQVARRFALAQVIAGIPIALVGVHYPEGTIFFIPLLLIIQHGGYGLAVEHRASKLDKVESRLEKTQAALESSKDLRQQTRGKLQQKGQELHLLGDFAHFFASNPTVEQVLDGTLEASEKLLPVTNRVIFESVSSGARAVAYRGPSKKRLSGQELTAVQEPIVLECLRLNRPVVSQPELRQSPRLFESDSWAVAIPIRGFGALYLGDPQARELTDRERSLLSLVASQASLGLESARYRGRLESALQQREQAVMELTQWNTGLNSMLAGTRAMTRLSEAELLERLELLLEEVVGAHRGRMVGYEERKILREWPAEQNWNINGTLELVEAVGESQRPLLFEEIHTSRFSNPIAGFESWLVVPVQHEDAMLAVLLIGIEAPGAFSTYHRDLVYLLASHTAALLRNCRLHEDLQRSQEQLVQSSKMAAVGQLAAGVAHELNSPLAAALLQLQAGRMRLESGNKEKVAHSLDVAERSTMKAQHIIDNLLKFSRASSTLKKSVSLNQVVDETLELLGEQLKVELHNRIQRDFFVHGNLVELQQIVTNLLLNARDAAQANSEERAPEIFIETTERDDMACLRVLDSGAGITEEAMPRLFEPFFTTKLIGEGTGLGLSISYQIAEDHDGRLEASNRDDGGACFELWLPLTLAPNS